MKKNLRYFFVAALAMVGMNAMADDVVFDFDNGAKQIYLQVEETDSVTFGFENKQFYIVNNTSETVGFGFDSNSKELYITIGD